MRPIAASVASGSVTGALVTLLRELSDPSPFPPLPPASAELCSLLPPLADTWGLDFRSLVLGILIGLVLLPCLDLLLVARLAWLRAVRQALPARPPGPFHRLLHE